MQASVNEHNQLEIDAFRRAQAVKVSQPGVKVSRNAYFNPCSQHRCDVLVPRRWMYQSVGGVEHQLKSTELGRSESCDISDT